MPAKPVKMGRPSTGGRKVTCWFDGPELIALDRIAAEHDTSRATMAAMLAVELMIEDGHLIRNQEGEVHLLVA